MKIYLAGPISGKGYDEVVGLYQEKSRMFKGWGYEVLCPMTGKTHLKGTEDFKAQGYLDSIANDHSIFERDKWMVSQSDIVFADFSNSGERVSIGTVMELSWASLLNKHTVSIIPDGNVHNHSFVLEASDIIFTTKEQAFAYFVSLSKGIEND